LSVCHFKLSRQAARISQARKLESLGRLGGILALRRIQRLSPVELGERGSGFARHTLTRLRELKVSKPSLC
jgi:hypothetical protein